MHLINYNVINTLQKHDDIPLMIHVHANRKYHTIGTVPKSNRKIVERSNIDASNTHIHDRSLSWLDTETSIKSGGG
jgi:hypothetical protein